MKETSNGKESWAEAIERAKEHFNEGWRELARAAELAKSRGQDVWSEAQQKGRDAWVNAKAKGMENWEDAKTAGLDALEDARERGEEAFRDAEKIVKKYPGRAVGLSVLVGVLLGALLSRDRE